MLVGVHRVRPIAGLYGSSVYLSRPVEQLLLALRAGVPVFNRKLPEPLVRPNLSSGIERVLLAPLVLRVSRDLPVRQHKVFASPDLLILLSRLDLATAEDGLRLHGKLVT